MTDAVDLLHRLVLAVGHDITCPLVQPSHACQCGKTQVLREAHSEACRLLRSLGRVK